MTLLEKLTGDKEGQYPHFAWPGGYAMAYVMDDGEFLCATCVTDQSNPVHEEGENDGWKIVGYTHTDETDEEMTCAHCYKKID